MECDVGTLLWAVFNAKGGCDLHIYRISIHTSEPHSCKFHHTILYCQQEDSAFSPDAYKVRRIVFARDIVLWYRNWDQPPRIRKDLES